MAVKLDELQMVVQRCFVLSEQSLSVICSHALQYLLCFVHGNGKRTKEKTKEFGVHSMFVVNLKLHQKGIMTSNGNF